MIVHLLVLAIIVIFLVERIELRLILPNFLISENRVEHSSAYEKHTTYEDKANDSKH